MNLTPGELARLQRLTAETRELGWLVLEEMARRGFDAYVGSTARSAEETAKAVASGHSSADQKHSWHELRRAIDFRQRKAGGGPNFDQGPASEPFWRALYEVSTALGMRSLGYRPDGSKLIIQGSKGPIWDSGHVEWRQPFRTLAEAFAAEGTT